MIQNSIGSSVGLLAAGLPHTSIFLIFFPTCIRLLISAVYRESWYTESSELESIVVSDFEHKMKVDFFDTNSKADQFIFRVCLLPGC